MRAVRFAVHPSQFRLPFHPFPPTFLSQNTSAPFTSNSIPPHIESIQRNTRIPPHTQSNSKAWPCTPRNTRAHHHRRRCAAVGLVGNIAAVGAGNTAAVEADSTAVVGSASLEVAGRWKKCMLVSERLDRRAGEWTLLCGLRVLGVAPTLVVTLVRHDESSSRCRNAFSSFVSLGRGRGGARGRGRAAATTAAWSWSPSSYVPEWDGK